MGLTRFFPWLEHKNNAYNNKYTLNNVFFIVCFNWFGKCIFFRKTPEFLAEFPDCPYFPGSKIPWLSDFLIFPDRWTRWTHVFNFYSF